KTRKKEAKLKLDATEQDLARIEDLLFEINNQLKTLESQARKAERYFEIKKEYKEVSIELAKAALEGFNITYRDLNQQQQQEVDRRIELETAIAKEEAALEKEKLGFIEKEKALQEMQHAFNDLQHHVRGKENEKNLAVQRLQHLKEKREDLNEFIQKAAGQVSGLEESIQFTGKQIEEEELKLGDLESSLDQLQEAVEDKRRVFDDKRSSIDQLRQTNQAIQRQQFDAEKKVAVADTSIQNLQRSIHQIQEEKAARQEQLRLLEQDKKEKEQQLSDRQRDLEQLQTEHEFTKEQILQTQQVLEGLRHNLADENRKLDARKNEHDLLKSLVDSMEGYPESVKYLHNNPSWNHGAPLLSDIIYVKEEYRAAVENVLEPYLNYYVVKDLQEGLAAVHLLDENKKGKANFFLMDQFTVAEKGHQPAGTIPALEVVEVDEPYKKIAAYLLGHVYIADNDEVLQQSNGSVILEKHGKYVKGKYAL
ncbi:MAG TPA: chromosome segregation protein SMC, partial [Ferruginibacter sp.]|nr:chromosome segregation protein SMC [Ferruginibacter sp.]